jgi:hypothetical protein
VKILVTGMTTSQAGRQTQLGIMNAVDLFVQALRDTGHEVDWRPPEVDDPQLASYDAVLVGLGATINFAAGHAWPAMWTIGNAKRLGVKLGTFVDDWRLFDIYPKMLYLIRNKDKLLKPVLAERRGNEWIRERPEELQRVARAFVNNRWPPCLVPQFAWGRQDDPRWDRWLPSRQRTFVDPSAYVPRIHGLEPKAPEDRERVWVSAALENPKNLVKLNLQDRFSTWPLERLGSRAAGEPRLQESEVIARYHQVWGVVSLPHNRISGLGWWRNRFVYAAQAGAILSAWPEELPALAGDPDVTGHGYLPSQLELMSTDQLVDVARRQANTIRFAQHSREYIQETVDSFVRNLV